MLHVRAIGPYSPQLPERRWNAAARLAVSASLHAAALAGLLWLVRAAAPPLPFAAAPATVARQPVDVTHVVFIARGPLTGGGGGGGGNRQSGPIRHAEGIGTDAITLRVAKPRTATPTTTASMEAPTLPALVLDAKPLASGAFDQVGLPVGGVGFGTSTGPGSGGGVGTGTGTGIGPGTGPGIGPGSGGGIGGGVYRSGGAVTSPRVLVEVKPAYTSDALRRRVQGTVVMELIVTSEGRPEKIRVVRSLDPELDVQATIAAAQWRFAPGQLAGAPVDVLVTVSMDFHIR